MPKIAIIGLGYVGLPFELNNKKILNVLVMILIGQKLNLLKKIIAIFQI